MLIAVPNRKRTSTTLIEFKKHAIVFVIIFGVLIHSEQDCQKPQLGM